MNKISQLLFSLVMLARSVYRQWGVNTTQLSLILRYKLIMDDRHPNTFQQTRGTQKKEGISNATYGTMLMSLLVGFLYLLFFFAGRDNTTHYFFFFSAFMFMLASMLISDFTSVLIDVRDNMIILPKPVNDRTVVMAKLLHIMVHMIRLVLPMSLPVLAMLLMKKEWLGTAALIFMIMLSAIFCIFLINAVYLLVLKITTAEKFKSFIAWFQIGFAVFLYGAYQLIPRIADMEDVQQFSIKDTWYAVFFPPYWFARSWEFINGESMAATWPWFILSVGSTLLEAGFW